jgi:hypothetical protein
MLDSFVRAGFHTGAAFDTFVYIGSCGSFIDYFIYFCGAGFRTFTRTITQIIIYFYGASDFFTFPGLNIGYLYHLLSSEDQRFIILAEYLQRYLSRFRVYFTVDASHY